MTRMVRSPLDACRAQVLRRTRDGRGVILPLTLIILLLLEALVTALLATGVTEPQIAGNSVRGNQALSLAEAGAEKAIGFFVANVNSNVTTNLVSCAMANPPENGCASATPTTPPTTLYANCGGAGNPCGDDPGLANLGTYTVTYQPISFATLLIQSTAQTRIGNAQRVVRVVVTQAFNARFGVLGKDVSIGGNAHVTGNAGAIQGNNSASVFGNSSIALTATSSTQCTTCTCDGCTGGNVGMPAQSGPGRPYAPIPTATPASVLTQALSTPNVQVVIMGPTTGSLTVTVAECGTVTVPANQYFNRLAIPGGPPACQSTADPIYSGASPPPGVYYSITAIGPINNKTWNATLLSASSIKTTGNVTLTPYFNGLLAVADSISTTGNATLGSAAQPGTIFATGTAGVSFGAGTPILTGNVVSAGLAQMRGNITINYNIPNRPRLLSPTLQILSWSTT